jgi:methyl-accepting chemotaxis protein
MEVIPVFLSELQKHVTTRLTVLNTVTLETLRSLTDVIVKEASTSAASLIVDVSGVIASAEAGLEKAKEALDALAKADLTDVVGVAGATLNVVETVAETVEKVADGVGDAGKAVNETVGNAKAVLEGAGLGTPAVTKVVDAVQTGVGVVIEVAEKAEEIAKKVDDVVDKAEAVVAQVAHVQSRLAPVFAVLKRYLCCCCKKSA